MAASTVRALLQRGAGDIDHEQVLKACDAALRKSRDDSELQHIRAVALLNLDRFDEALKLFADSKPTVKERAPLAFAYALYKTGLFAEAQKVVGRQPPTRAALHLEAQAAYRLDEAASARTNYEKLLEGGAEEEENDIHINLSAVDAQQAWLDGVGLPVAAEEGNSEDAGSFEATFNLACRHIAQGQLQDAERLIKSAQDMCNAHGDLTEEEKQAELQPMLVQQIHVLSLLGKHEEASAAISQLEVKALQDPATKVIGQLNKLAAKQNPQNPYLTYRIFHEQKPLSEANRLFHFQSLLQDQNSRSLDLLSSKFELVKKRTDQERNRITNATTELNRLQADTLNHLSVANAAAHAQNEIGKPALRPILPLIKQRPKDFALTATAIQILLSDKNHGTAITLLEEFAERLEQSGEKIDQEVRFSPGVVSLLVSLYSVEGRKAHIRAEMAKAASYWRDQPRKPSKLLLSAGVLLLESEKEEDVREAALVFDDLKSESTARKFANAGAIAAHAAIDATDIAEDDQVLVPVKELIRGVDVSALEQAGVPQSSLGVLDLLSRKRAAAEEAKPARKRVRKSRLPKNYDPSKPPDPERWLPVRDRSSYKPKGKKGKQKQAALTQGGVSEKAAQALDVTGTDSTRAVSPGVAVGTAGGNKNKKKKGKK